MKLIYKKETEVIPEEKGHWPSSWASTPSTWTNTIGETFNMDAWVIATQQYQALTDRLAARYVHRHPEAELAWVQGIADYPPNPQ